MQGLMMDLFHPTSRVSSNRELSVYRNQAITYYFGSGSAYCMVTGEQRSKEGLVAGHIYRRQWPKSMLGKINIKQHEPANIILMLAPLEKAFDKWFWTVLPEGHSEFKVHVLNPVLLNDPMPQYIEGREGPGMTWRQVHGRSLTLPADKHPSRRVCGFHAALAIQHAEVKGWIEKGSVVVPDAAWGSPKCDKQLMQQFLDSLVQPPDLWQVGAESAPPAGSGTSSSGGGNV